MQGVAEVLPVSSSAQLALLPTLLGWPQPAHRTAFAAALHAGSTAGVLWALRREVRDLRPAEAVTLLASCLPAAATGVLVDDAVERRLGGAHVTAALLGAAGAVLWWADRRPATRSQVTATDAAVASLAQLAALAPGVSRSGATLTALRLRGVERAAAARFSLLMALPVTGAAALLPLARDRHLLRSLGPQLRAGIPAAAASAAVAATAWRAAPGRGLRAAAVYRLGLAAVVLARRPRS